MFPGGHLHDDKEGLFPVGCDEQEQFLEDRAVCAFQKTLLSRIHELDVIQRQKALLSKDHAVPNLATELPEAPVNQQHFQELLAGGTSSQRSDQEIFHTEQATKLGLLPGGYNCQDEYVLSEGGVTKLLDEIVFSEDDSSQQTVPSEPCVNQRYADVRVLGCREDRNSVEDNVPGSSGDQNTFSTDHVTRRVGQNALSGSLGDEHNTFPEAHASKQDVTSEERLLEQAAFTGGRLTQRLDNRTVPRQLDMGK
jgi:hypothetical protein